MRKHLSRREFFSFLTQAGVVSQLVRLDPSGQMKTALNEVLETIIPKAQGTAASEMISRRLIALVGSGGYSDWFWSLPLSVNESAVMYNGSNASTANFYRKNNQMSTCNTSVDSSKQPIYKTHPIVTSAGTRHFPYLWRSDIPAFPAGSAGTGTPIFIPMENLVANMCVIRGAPPVQGDVGHVRDVMLSGQAGTSSPTALPAEYSNRPMPPIFLTNFGFSKYKESYNSKKGIAALGVGQDDSANDLQDLVSPFLPLVGSNVLTRAEAIRALIDTALSEYQLLSMSSHPGSEIFFDNYNNSLRLMYPQAGDSDISTIGTKYDAALAKYRTLISFALAGVMPGTNQATMDLNRNYPIYGLTEEGLNITSDGGDLFIYPDGRMPNLFALKNMFQNPDFSGLAETFAKAETFAILDLTASFVGKVFYDVGIGNLKIGSNFGNNYGIDSHGADDYGVFWCMFSNLYMWRAYAACLNELIRVLTETTDLRTGSSLFEDTVIVKVSEYSRAPSAGVYGDEHAPETANVSIWSGAIQGKTHILGNCLINTSNGTYGAAAPVDFGSGNLKMLDNEYIAETIGHMCRCPQQAPNKFPLLVESASGGFTPIIEEAEDV